MGGSSEYLAQRFYRPVDKNKQNYFFGQSFDPLGSVTFVPKNWGDRFAFIDFFGSTVPLVADLSADTFLPITKAAPTSLGVRSFNSFIQPAR